MNAPNAPVRPAPQGASVTLIIVAASLGLVTVFMTLFYVRAVRKDIEGSAMVVYRVNKALEPGQELNVNKDLEPIIVSSKFKDGLEAMSIKFGDKGALPVEYHNQPVTRHVNQGEYLSPSFFTGGGTGVANKISPGKRGTVLAVNSRNAPGLLQPGMYIDISGSFQRPTDKVPVAIRIMCRVKVVAVGANTDETGSAKRMSYNSITVETEPEEDLALLTIAKFVGKDGFDISIRNPGDTDAPFVGVNKDILKIVGLER
ncbi:MAG: hypothetical protein GC162_02605 [Planctomycetes bacterium]|nr:hypothetical protein [Planctomycetota bacterium]